MVGRVGARLRLSIDATDDLRIAIDEAFALLAPASIERSTATLELQPSTEALRATLRMHVDVGRWPPPGLEGSLPWTVILGLTDSAEVASHDGEGLVVLIKRTLGDLDG
jgi:hypothetical protein